jgi:hypothetical protein
MLLAELLGWIVANSWWTDPTAEDCSCFAPPIVGLCSATEFLEAPLPIERLGPAYDSSASLFDDDSLHGALNVSNFRQ